MSCIKNSLLSIAFIAFSISAIGQAAPDSNGFTIKTEATNLKADSLKDGKWMEYLDANSHVTPDTNAPYYRLTIYKKGIPYGIVRGYTRKGMQCVKITYRNGKKNGLSQTYEKGKVITSTPYNNDSIDGVAKEFYESGGIKSEITYTHNKKNGVAKGYYEDGKLMTVDTNVNDMQNGVMIVYYESGKMRRKVNHLNGKLNGMILGYYETGAVKYEIPCSNDVSGTVRNFDESGNEIKL
ncbi:MAG TPA: toxin-antitoxin system YwqK family antitoxin [Bacteroidia bacterium]|nr:toxin-antitoxin system YwqK family antitoxin [Bacteroidia bacterium]